MEEAQQPQISQSKEEIIQQIKDNFNKFMLTFNPNDADYQMDELQNRMLEFYLANDRKFRRSFHVNFTESFIIYLKDKARLKEPNHLSIMGIVRSGKSSIASTIGFLVMAMYGKLFSVEPYVTANNVEFLEKINEIDQSEVGDTIFQIDEEKSFYGIGSTSKKSQILDANNIIAKKNISTISLSPHRFADNMHYGIRLFGRSFSTKTCRMMLYNLLEGKASLPLGLLYFPIPEAFLPKDLFLKFNTEYQNKKDTWIEKERRGETDVMGELKRKTAQRFINDPQYVSLTKKAEKLTYLSLILGNNWTVGEKLEIYNITKLYDKGINLDH